MIKLWSTEKSGWTEEANRDMTIGRMFEYLFTMKLTKSISAHSVEYKKLYDGDKDFILEIIEIFFPDLNFIPSRISKKNTSEYYLFEVLSSIINIKKYYELEKSKKDGYSKEMKKYNASLTHIQKYSEIIVVHDGFPQHKNETIVHLEQFFKSINRIQQGNKIIEQIKQHFGITRITQTKRMKCEKNISNFIKEETEQKGAKYKTKITPRGTEYSLENLKDIIKK